MERLHRGIELFAELRRIWLDHLVILLPGQDINTDQRLSSQ